MSLQATDATVVTLGRDHSIIRWDTEEEINENVVLMHLNCKLVFMPQRGAGAGGAGSAGGHRESGPRRKVPR